MASAVDRSASRAISEPGRIAVERDRSETAFPRARVASDRRAAVAKRRGSMVVDRPGVAWDWMSRRPGARRRRLGAAAGRRSVGASHRGSRAPPRRRSRAGRRDADSRAAPIEAPIGAVASRLSRPTPMICARCSATPRSRCCSHDPEAAVIHILRRWPRHLRGAGADDAGRRRWREAAVGNNGVGTASLLCAPVAFDGKEHFNRALHRFAVPPVPDLVRTDGSARSSA